MARAFDMEVHYRDQARLPADLEQGAIFHDSDESFLPQCHVLSLNAPGGRVHPPLAECRAHRAAAAGARWSSTPPAAHWSTIRR